VLFVLAEPQPASFAKLAAKLNEHFKTSELYKGSPNKIEINTDLTIMCIKTKYYNLNLRLELVSLDSLTSTGDLLKEKLERFHPSKGFVLEGFLVLLSDNGELAKLSIESFVKSIKLMNNNDEERPAGDDVTQLEMNPNARLNLFITSNLSAESELIAQSLLEKYDDQNDYLELNVDLEGSQSREVTQEDDDSEDQDEFTDLDELINCLFVHSWSGLELVEQPAKSEASQRVVATATDLNKAKVDEKDEDLDDESADTLADFGFENLLINLSEMKEKADGMSFDERKKYAEQVVVNFWKSIGGDMDEISGLDDELAQEEGVD
jgi:hypothetical protein